MESDVGIIILGLWKVLHICKYCVRVRGRQDYLLTNLVWKYSVSKYAIFSDELMYKSPSMSTTPVYLIWCDTDKSAQPQTNILNCL